MFESQDAEWVRQDNSHRLNMEKERSRQIESRSEYRRDWIIGVSVTLGVVGVLLAITYAIFAGSQATGEREHVQIIECTKRGGAIIKPAGAPLVCVEQDGDL